MNGRRRESHDADRGHRRRDGPGAFAGGINTDRASMRGDEPGVNDFQPLGLEEVLQARQRIIAQMLVVDGVPLASNDAGEVVVLGDEHPVVVE